MRPRAAGADGRGTLVAVPSGEQRRGGATGRRAPVQETVEENRPEIVPSAVAHRQSAEHNIQREQDVCAGRRKENRRDGRRRRRDVDHRGGTRDRRHRARQDSTIGERGGNTLSIWGGGRGFLTTRVN